MCVGVSGRVRGELLSAQRKITFVSRRPGLRSLLLLQLFSPGLTRGPRGARAAAAAAATMSHPPPANDFDGLLSDDEEEPVREEGKHFFNK